MNKAGQLHKNGQNRHGIQRSCHGKRKHTDQVKRWTPSPRPLIENHAAIPKTYILVRIRDQQIPNFFFTFLFASIPSQAKPSQAKPASQSVGQLPTGEEATRIAKAPRTVCMPAIFQKLTTSVTHSNAAEREKPESENSETQRHSGVEDLCKRLERLFIVKRGFHEKAHCSRADCRASSQHLHDTVIILPRVRS